ncbi:MAG: hypothetical protein IJQ44_04245 [Bacteroidaceae bacterium]|nr:hypothetical protein [Bacteroidaceae bacterium]
MRRLCHESETAVSDSGDGCLTFMIRLSQIQVTAVSDSGDGCLRFR